MGMDITGASLTRQEVESISNDIKTISEAIATAMGFVNDAMTELTGQSEGGIIDKATTAVEQLTKLCETLIDSIYKIAEKIWSYVESMFNYDREAAGQLVQSTQHRIE